MGLQKNWLTGLAVITPLLLSLMKTNWLKNVEFIYEKDAVFTLIVNNFIK